MNSPTRKRVPYLKIVITKWIHLIRKFLLLINTRENIYVWFCFRNAIVNICFFLEIKRPSKMESAVSIFQSEKNQLINAEIKAHNTYLNLWRRLSLHGCITDPNRRHCLTFWRTTQKFVTMVRTPTSFIYLFVRGDLRPFSSFRKKFFSIWWWHAEGKCAKKGHCLNLQKLIGVEKFLSLKAEASYWCIQIPNFFSKGECFNMRISWQYASNVNYLITLNWFLNLS